MSISYDKTTRAQAAAKNRPLATIEVAGLNFQGGVTPAEQKEFIRLYQLVSERAAAEAVPPTPPAATSDV